MLPASILRYLCAPLTACQGVRCPITHREILRPVRANVAPDKRACFQMGADQDGFPNACSERGRTPCVKVLVTGVFRKRRNNPLT